jgi:hypothetical protein
MDPAEGRGGAVTISIFLHPAARTREWKFSRVDKEWRIETHVG